jgi:hypothetical protein
MSLHLGFGPDPDRARLLDRRMHTELAASLRYLRERLAAAREPAAGLDPARLDAPIAAIDAGHRLDPRAFAAYYDLAGALMDGDAPAARLALAELGAAQAQAPRRTHAPLRAPDACERSARYVRMFAGEGPDDIVLRPLPPERADAFAGRFERGVALMRAAFPELAGEVDGLVHEVVAIASDPGRAEQFDGGSHYRLWGALFLNADFHPTDAAMVEVIAHESAHSLLFGLCTEEALVGNDDDERYASPLRSDLRPMDGIYHATFVSARMHLATSRLLSSGLLDDAARAQAVAARDADRRNFEAGHSVVARHGVLTPLGREVMAGAAGYMAAS